MAGGRSLGCLVVLAAGLLLWPATGSGRPARSSALTISPIHAKFVESERETIYSVDKEDDDPGAQITYQWTLALKAVDPTKPVDAGCDNHGRLKDDFFTFVWQHGNINDDVRDDGCDHSKVGQYGHQGLITVRVRDDEGNECTATYKGTNSSDANSVSAGVASEPDCHEAAKAPGEPRCHCAAFLMSIPPKSVQLDELLNEREEVRLTFDLHWSLHCEGGKGGCRAAFTVHPSPSLGLGGFQIDGKTKQLTVHCVGVCNGARQGSRHVVLLTDDVSPTDYKRWEGPVKISLGRTCQGARLKAQSLTLAFKYHEIDVAKSKLHY